MRAGRLFRTHFYAALILANVIAVHYVVGRHHGAFGAAKALEAIHRYAPSLAGSLLAGLILRLGWAWWTDRLGPLRRRVVNATWILTSVEIVIAGALLIHGYAWLKVMVPLINPGTFDAELWELDRLLLFGFSPNVLFLNLFSYDWFLTAIDWSYAFVFIGTMTASNVLFLSMPANRIRIAFVTSNATLWIVSAWIYVAIPSLGPCYAFPGVWTDFFEIMGHSRYWQYRLLQNYQNVLELARSPQQIRVFEGVAAFPSLHVAFQMLIALWLRQLSKKLALVWGLLVALILIGSVITGWHYLIDGIAGILLAWAIYRITLRAFGLTRWERLRS